MESWRRAFKVKNIIENVCNCNTLRSKSSFGGWNDYDNFLQMLKTTDSFRRVPVAHYLYSVNVEENWYQCVECEKIWRLIEPDPPFAGQWQPVEEENSIEE